MRKFNRKQVERGVEQLLKGIGEDVNREGIQETPKRVAKAFMEMTSGYRQSSKKILTKRFTVGKYDEMIACRSIDFYSLCEHHLLPFWGKVHIAYIPKDRVIGLSKMPRLVDMFAKRLQIQEQMTTQIAETMQKELQPKGVAVMIEAQHLCMKMRGVKKSCPDMVTTKLFGAFQTDPTRNEFLNLVERAAFGTRS